MRLLNVICSTNPALGGVIEWVRQFGPLAESLGHTVEVASMDNPEDPWVEAFPLRVYALGQRFRYYHSPRLVPWLRENRHRYDVVLAHGLWRYASFGTWRALHDTDTPYFVYTHGMLDPWFKHEYPLKHLGKWLYWPWTDYRVLRDAKGVIFTCEQERRKARESFGLYCARELVTTIGIRAPTGDPDMQRASFHDHFPETRGKRILLFLGRIHPKKGCDLLIETFGKTARADGRLHLVMAGPDNTGWIPRLREIAHRHGIDDRISWAGMIGGDIKWGAFHAAEAFVLPSHQENFGIAVVEAMACETPVLISNKVDIFTEIQEDGAGLVEQDTQQGMDELLRRWLASDAAFISRMQRNALKSFSDRFEISGATKGLMGILERESVPAGQ